MFNLDKAIADWRKAMSTAGITSRDVLDELEAHLRDHIDQEIQSGANEQQAFEAAVTQLGKITVVRDEFVKTKLNGERPIFLKACYVVFGSCMLLINFWTLLINELPPAERILGFFAVSLVCLYLAGLPYFLKSLRAAIYPQLTKFVKVSFFVSFLWPIWELLEAEHVVHSGMGLVPQMVLWSLYSAVLMTVIAVALHESGPRPGNGGGLPPPFEPCPIPAPPNQPPPSDISISVPQTASFNSVAREALNAAAQEASRLGHDFIGTEHVLLGALKLAQGPFEEFLQRLQLDCAAVRLETERLVPPVLARHEGGNTPLTPRACKALRLAANEAKKLRQPAIGVEHIFLGLLLENGGVAGQVLRRLGIRMKRAREEIVRSLRPIPRR